jgi:UPF0755 protein
MLRRMIQLLILASLAVGAFLLWQRFAIERWGSTPLALSQPVEVDFARGQTLRSLAESLAKAGVIDTAETFVHYARLFGDPRRFQAGHYRFEGQPTPAQIVEMISLGRTYEPVVLSFTIPEGFTAKQIIARLAAQNVGTTAEIAKEWQSSALLKELEVPARNFEGFFYPATYSFTKMLSASEAITAGVKKFWEVLPPDYEQKAKSLGLSLLQAITFASLIELETRLDSERTMVSEVIWNRLKNREPLGIDAALIYGIDDYQGDIKWKHLKDKKNPYNTRIHRGLPPTPIASPAKNSILAVLNPSNAGYYYYVREVGSDDRHVFSKTHAEHQAHVRRFVEWDRRVNAAKGKK